MAKKGGAISKRRLRAVDVTETEAALESVRREKIVSGKPATDKSNEELFFLDQKGVTDASEKKFLGQRGLLMRRPLRIDEILRPQSAIEPLRTNYRKAKKKEEERKNKLFEKLIKKKAAAIPPTSKPTKQDSKPPIYDIWEETKKEVKIEKEKRKEKSKKSSAKRKGQNAVLIKRIPAVKVPQAGASYRPEEGAHRKLLEKVKKAKLEERIAWEEASKTLVIPKMLTGASSSLIGETVKEILSGYRRHSNEKEATSDDDDDQEENQGNANDAQDKTKMERSTRKKTEIQRKRMRRHKELQHQQVLNKRNKQLINQLTQVKRLDQQVKEEFAKKELCTRKKHTSIKTQLLSNKTKSLSTTSVQQAAEIAGSLRTIKPHGTLVLDRFRSLQERGLIEPSLANGKGKGEKTERRVGRVKLVEKWSFKSFK